MTADLCWCVQDRRLAIFSSLYALIKKKTIELGSYRKTPYMKRLWIIVRVLISAAAPTLI